MTTARQGLGTAGESLAAAELQRQGYTMREANWRCRLGEIDLVAEQDDSLVFVEVRTRRGVGFGTPEESVTPAKQAHLIAAAQTYVQTNGWTGAWRIDVVAVQLDSAGRLQRITVIPNAVGE